MYARIYFISRRPPNNGEYIMMIPGLAYRRSLFPLAGYMFILLLLLPIPVFAQNPVELRIEETSIFPWNATGILPGDRGSTFIDLHNNGTE
jgi:hypothetical protein